MRADKKITSFLPRRGTPHSTLQVTEMKCKLCEKEIDHYSVEFNRMVIDDTRSVDICRDCIDTFLEWQGKKYATLFPTTAMKRRYEKKREI